ncbi:MAG TPA: hypothetical protein VF980_07480 [Thermoanaerobaculia bacterium]
MSSTAPTELTAALVISQIEARAYTPEVLTTIARGFLPLPQEDLIVVLSYMSENADEEFATIARASLADIPARSVNAFASNESASPDSLKLLARASRDAHVLESLIRNRAVRDETVVEVARRADAHVQDIIVINQLRILRAPEIIDALLENPNVTPDTRRRALENREEFFEKKARLEQLKQILGAEEMIDEAAPDDAISDLLEQAVADKTPATTLGEISVKELEDKKQQSVWALVLKMTVSEKVQLAFKGDKTLRMILIRDRNRLVASSAIRNPRMSENEVESIAGMRNVEEEVLRIIGRRRDWTSKYPIAIALAKNPKAPIGVVLPLINRLTLRDLKGLKDDKGVSEAVRVNARKLYQARQKT